MRCNECITEMHKLNAIVKAGAAEYEVSEDHVLFCLSNSVSRNTWQPTTAPPWRGTTSSSARSTWPTATRTCSWWSWTTSLWTAPSTSAWPWGSVTPSRTSSSTRSQGRKSQVKSFPVYLPPIQVHLWWVCRGHGLGGGLHEGPALDCRVHSLPWAELLRGNEAPVRGPGLQPLPAHAHHGHGPVLGPRG